MLNQFISKRMMIYGTENDGLTSIFEVRKVQVNMIPKALILC